MLDIRTIYISGISIFATCSLTVWLMGARAGKDRAGVRLWAAGFTLQAVCALLIALRGSIPDFASIVAANVLSVLGAWLAYAGYCRLAGVRRFQWPHAILLAAFAAVHAYFTFVRPDLDARSINISAGLGYFTLRSGLLLARRFAGGSGGARLAALANFGYAAICAARIVVYIAHPPADQNYMRATGIDVLWQVAFQALFLLHTGAMGLLLQARLSEGLRENEEKFAKAFRTSPYGLAITDAATGVVEELNEGAAAISGYAEAEALGARPKDLGLWVDPAQREALAAETMRAGRVTRREAAIRRKDGGLGTVLVSTETIAIGGRRAILWLIDDITERKAMEDEIRRLLDARETLLREVHHRLKNNMSAVSSLLALQADRAGAGAREVLADAARRVDVMEYLYEKVYRSEHYEAMALDEFLGPLARDVLESFPRAEDVRLELALDDRPIGPEKLMPLGMLATEIVGNSMKHAFKGRPGGRISIRSAGDFALVFEDDGVGFEPASPMARGGFGYTLIEALTKQLRGSFKVEGRGGTRVTIEFTP